MQPLQNQNLISVQRIKNEKGSNDILKTLFQKAQEGTWEQIIPEIYCEPHLVNEPMRDGPDAGKTLLWIATLQLVENYYTPKGDSAYEFIDGLIRYEINLNIDAAPLDGDLAGANVLWLLAQFQILQLDTHHWYESEREVYMRKILHLISSILIRHPLCNINSAPIKGDFKGVTTFSLLIGYSDFRDVWGYVQDLTRKSKEICDSATPPLQNQHTKDKCNVMYGLAQMIQICDRHIHPSTVEYRKDLQDNIEDVDDSDEDLYFYPYYDFYEKNSREIQSNCYKHLIKIIEKNPKCNVNFQTSGLEDYYSFSLLLEEKNMFPKNILEKIMWLPSASFLKEESDTKLLFESDAELFSDREKLLLYLIFAGGKLTDNAQKIWKEKFDEIHQKLKSVFRSALNIYCTDLAEGCQLTLPKELRWDMALNMVLTSFPELKVFPSQIIKEKMVYRFFG